MKRKIIPVLGLGIPAALLICATAARPYTLAYQNGSYVHWDPKSTVTLVYNLNFPPPSAAMQPDLVQATIHHVLNEWNAVLATMPIALRLVDGGTTTVNNPACDGVNVITFTDTATSFPTGVMAFTAYSTATGPGTIPAGACGPKAITTTFAGQIIDADITFNPAYAISPVGLNSVYAANVSATNPVDLEGTLLLQTGRLLGLAHSGIPSAVMSAFSSQFHGIHSLTTDDIAGLNAAYGVNVSDTTVSGKVVDQSGNPVIAAHVVLTDATTGLVTVSALTQTDGTYQIVGFPPSSATKLTSSHWTVLYTPPISRLIQRKLPAIPPMAPPVSRRPSMGRRSTSRLEIRSRA